MVGIGNGGLWIWLVFYSGYFGWWVLDMLIWYWVWWVCWEMGFGVYWMDIWFRKGNGKVGHLIRMVGNFGRVG